MLQSLRMTDLGKSNAHPLAVRFLVAISALAFASVIACAESPPADTNAATPPSGPTATPTKRLPEK
jgi:hypothetical protein